MNPADLTPEQIGEALHALCQRDCVCVSADCHVMGQTRWQVSQLRLKEPHGYQGRTGVGVTYDAALSACRAAEFGKWESK